MYNNPFLQLLAYISAMRQQPALRDLGNWRTIREPDNDAQGGYTYLLPRSAFYQNPGMWVGPSFQQMTNAGQPYFTKGQQAEIAQYGKVLDDHRYPQPQQPTRLQEIQERNRADEKALSENLATIQSMRGSIFNRPENYHSGAADYRGSYTPEQMAQRDARMQMGSAAQTQGQSDWFAPRGPAAAQNIREGEAAESMARRSVNPMQAQQPVQPNKEYAEYNGVKVPASQYSGPTGGFTAPISKNFWDYINWTNRPIEPSGPFRYWEGNQPGLGFSSPNTGMSPYDVIFGD